MPHGFFSTTTPEAKDETASDSPKKIRIFVDGVFDLFHIGHHNLINNAIRATKAKHPDSAIEVVIGICGEGVKEYKRETIMTLEERYLAVDAFMQGLMSVQPNLSYEIIQNSPIEHTVEFIRQNRLNVIFHGSDFTEEKIEKYYGVIKRECAGTCTFEILPYTPGVSTTQLIADLWEHGQWEDTANTTGISMAVLAQRVQAREDLAPPKAAPSM